MFAAWAVIDKWFPVLQMTERSEESISRNSDHSADEETGLC